MLRERADQHPDADDVAAWLERVATPGRGASAVLCPSCDTERLHELAEPEPPAHGDGDGDAELYGALGRRIARERLFDEHYMPAEPDGRAWWRLARALEMVPASFEGLSDAERDDMFGPDEPRAFIEAYKAERARLERGPEGVVNPELVALARETARDDWAEHAGNLDAIPLPSVLESYTDIAEWHRLLAETAALEDASTEAELERWRSLSEQCAAVARGRPMTFEERCVFFHAYRAELHALKSAEIAKGGAR